MSTPRLRWATSGPARLVAASAGLSLALAACGGSDDGGGDGDSSGGAGETLSVWIMEGTNPDATPFFEEVSTAFEEETGATLDVQFVPWASAHDQFTNAIAGGTTPDVAEVGTTWTPEFADAGALTDLTSDIEEAGLSEGYVDSLLEAGTLDGQVYGAPWYAGVRSFIYRTDMFEEAGVEPPTTWNELVEVGTTLKEQDPDVIPLPIPSSMHLYTPFLWGAGGDLATQDGESWSAGLDSDAARTGTQFYTDLALEHDLSTPAASTWNEVDVRDAFARGEAAMIISGSWTPASILEANPDLEGKLGAFPIPGTEGGMSPSFVGGSHLSIFEGAENPELAWEFVQLMTTGDFAAEWGEQSSFFPGTEELLAEIEEGDDPMVAPFATQMKEAGASMPVTPLMGQIEGAKIVPAMLQSILGGDATVEEATSTANDEMAEILNQ